MAYSEELAERIRDLVPEAREQKMFGGLAFFVNGNMAVAAGGKGGLLVRVGPEECDELIATTSAVQMEMRGRTITGWLRVPFEEDADEWIERGVAYAQTLPPK